MSKKVDDSNLETPERYSKGLGACETLEQLRNHVQAYADLAVDALPIVASMSSADFPEFIRGVRSERRGKFAGKEWAKRFIAVLMPEPMFTVARIATEYHAPFNVTLRRIKEVRPELLAVDSQRSET